MNLPTCEPERDREYAVDHGARVLKFLLETSCTATLSDLELERAELASQYAICARGISVPAANRLSDVRHVIASVLKTRRAEAPVQLPLATLGYDSRPDQGPMAGLLERPKAQPHAPEYARPEIRF